MPSKKDLTPSSPAHSLGWFALSVEGNRLEGVLLGMYEHPDELRAGPQAYMFQVRTSRECMIRVGTRDKEKYVVAPPHHVVNVATLQKTQHWQNLIPDVRRGAVYKIQCTVKPCLRLSRDRTMFNLDTSYQLVEPPLYTDTGPTFRARAASLKHELDVVTTAVRRLSQIANLSVTLRETVEDLRSLARDLRAEQKNLEQIAYEIAAKTPADEQNLTTDAAIVLRIAHAARENNRTEVAHHAAVLHRVWYLSNPTSETLLSSSTSSTRGLSTYCVSPYRATGVLLRVFDGNLADTTSTTSSRTPTWSLEPPHHLLC